MATSDHDSRGRLAPIAHVVLGATLAAAAGCETERTLDDVSRQAPPAEESVSPEAAASRGGDARAPLEADGAGAAALGRVVDIFVPHGAAAVLAPRQMTSDGARATIVLTVAAASCYAIAAAASDGEDVDLRVIAPGGAVVAEDRSPDSFPVLPSVCFDAEGAHVVEVSAVRGRLDAWVAAYALDATTAEAARRLAASAAAHAPGATPYGPVAAELVPTGGTLSVPVAVPPGRCVVAAAVGDVGVTDLDLAWVAGDGAAVWRDLGTDPAPFSGPVCDAAAAWRLDLRAYDGAGTVWWQLFAVPPPG